MPRPAGFASFMRMPMSSLEVVKTVCVSCTWQYKPYSYKPEIFKGISDMETLQATKDLDACIVGVPVDGATSNRPGTRSA